MEWNPTKCKKNKINSYNVMNTIFFDIYIDQESNMHTQTFKHLFHELSSVGNDNA